MQCYGANGELRGRVRSMLSNAQRILARAGLNDLQQFAVRFPASRPANKSADTRTRVSSGSGKGSRALTHRHVLEVLDLSTTSCCRGTTSPVHNALHVLLLQETNGETASDEHSVSVVRNFLTK